ncbi:MAG: hypothetical protein HYX68_00995 [Planctomycetes bacterium]|nr:hypothetical protein [Planctomycetota bacterium]
MNRPRRWDPCISHRGDDAVRFVEEYFAKDDRRIQLIAGAGFDPRTSQLPQILSKAAGPRLSALFIREERPSPAKEIVDVADANEKSLRGLCAGCAVERLDIFDIDEAAVGGRRATALLNKLLTLANITDVILDCSALSVGVFFPIAKYLYQRAGGNSGLNLHVAVLDNPKTDGAIVAESCGKASPLHAFQGGLNLDSMTDAARLWLPQLGPGKREVLRLVHQLVKPHAVCPILPFPATHPRDPDQLIEEYGDLFDSIGDPFETTWHVDTRDLVFAHQKNPVDLYRTILRIDDARTPVFEAMGRSQLILSPMGNKALSLGILMAALERDFAVVSVESIAYNVNFTVLNSVAASSGELVHIWLHGDAYVGQSSKEGLSQ